MEYKIEEPEINPEDLREVSQEEAEQLIDEPVGDEETGV